MREHRNVTRRDRVTGSALGGLGVLAFSMSLPATQVAVAELNPWLVAFGRAVGAALLACAYLRLSRAPRPTAQWRRLAVVAAGVVVGFPAFTSLALTTQTAAHGAVVVALLPAITAVFAVLRAGERPPRKFWAAGGAGLAAVLVFLVASGTAAGAVEPADLFLLAAVVLCGLGYAEGGAVARELGGARTICWALVLALPVTVPITAVAVFTTHPAAHTTAWLGFGYLTVVSMFLGFFAWYAGLARGGVAQVGQTQLAQPVLTLTWSALLLHQPATLPAVGAALLVVACVVITQRTRNAATAERPSPGAVPTVGAVGTSPTAAGAPGTSPAAAAPCTPPVAGAARSAELPRTCGLPGVVGAPGSAPVATGLSRERLRGAGWAD